MKYPSVCLYVKEMALLPIVNEAPALSVLEFPYSRLITGSASSVGDRVDSDSTPLMLLRPLRAAKYNGTVDSLPVKIIHVFVNYGNAVYVKPHYGILHPGTHAPQIDG